MSNRECILVVDEVSDTAEVLQAVLEPRGVTVNRVARWCQTETPTAENRPAVVVFDAESLDGGAPAGQSNWQGVPQIIIGTMRVAGSSDRSDAVGDESSRCYLQKPFQFSELVQAIEMVIARGEG